MNGNASRTEIKTLQNELNLKAKEFNSAIKAGATIGKAKKIYFELKAIKGRLGNSRKE